MRKFVARLTIAATFIGAIQTGAFAEPRLIPASLQGTTSAQKVVNSAIPSIFRQYPVGGADLSKRIADIVTADPNIATDIATYVTTASLTEGQRVAAAEGLSEAMSRLQVQNQVGAGAPSWLPILIALAVIGVIVGVIVANKKSSSPS